MVRISLCLRASLLLVCSVLPLAAQQPGNSTATTATAASVVVPPMVNFSGALADVNGKPRNGLVGVTFYLYKDSQGGAPLWMETQNVRTDKAGHYTAMLGSTSSQGLPRDLFVSGEARWLGVQVQGEAEQPRVLLLSVPYALKAADAETLGGKPLSSFQLVPAQSKNSSTQKTQLPADQANELRCAGGGTTCKTNFIPKFSSNGGSATQNDSVMSQTGTDIHISGNESVSGNISSGKNVKATHDVTAGDTVSGHTGAFSQSSSSPTVTVKNPGTGDGIDITVGNGNGVLVSNTGGVGVSASGSAVAILGSASATGAYGVLGVAANDSDFLPAIFGIQSGSTKRTLGVEGYTGSPDGAGVWGIEVGTSTLSSGFGQVAAVWGDTNKSFGVASLGSADDGFGVVGENNSTGDSTAFFDNNTTGSATAPVLTAVGSKFGGQCTIDVSGHLACTGTKSAVVPVDGGARKVALYAVEAPENWFEDFGSGRLVNGSAVINLEPTFRQTVNTAVEYHVFLTPNGDSRGLYIAQKSPTSFTVREQGGGVSSLAFDYRIVARRKGYEAVRLADKTREFSRPNPITMTKTHGRPVIPNSHDLKLWSVPHVSAVQSDK